MLRTFGLPGVGSPHVSEPFLQSGSITRPETASGNILRISEWELAVGTDKRRASAEAALAVEAKPAAAKQQMTNDLIMKPLKSRHFSAANLDAVTWKVKQP